MNPSQEQLILPKLREDLQLIEGDQDPITFERSWMIYDGLQHRYFKISSRIVHLLGVWVPGANADEFRDGLGGDLSDVTDTELRELVSFLASQNLIQLDSEVASQYLLKQHQSKQKSWISRLIHNYLFFRIPLVRPQQFLRNTAWVPKLMMLPLVVWGIWLFGLFGVGSIVTQFDQFWSTFSLLLSWEGAALYAVCLAVVKSLHELGHAYAATRYGARVSSMGIAFLVLFPVLYTDVTDAWRLTDRYQRFKIAIAGIATEFHIGLVACGIWALSDSDLVRSVAFVFATTSLIASVIVNISPFLRFDGYFAMSDLVGVENLQTRSFAMAKWRLRRFLFGFQESPPEQFEPTLRRTLTLYAFGTWIYRFFLFLGIAVLVYQLAFKVLGIILFVIEILYFILLPIAREAIYVVKNAREMRWTSTSGLSLLIAVALIGAVFVPQVNRVHIPVVLTDADYQPVFAPESAELNELFVREGEWIEKGQLIARLRDQQLLFERQRTQVLLERYADELKDASVASSGQEGQRVFMRQIARYQETLDSIDKRLANLEIRAKTSGQIRGNAAPHLGQVIEKGALLFEIVPLQKSLVIGYLPTEYRDALSPGDSATLIRGVGALGSQPLRVATVDIVAAQTVEYPELLSSWGGELIDMNQSAPSANSEQPKLFAPHHRVTFELLDTNSEQSVIRESAMVIAEQDQISFAQKWWRVMYSISIKELQF